MKHRTKRIDGTRLEAVLDALRRSGERGASIRELIFVANVTDPKDAIHELRHLGVGIESVWCESRAGKRYVRYVLEEAQISEAV